MRVTLFILLAVAGLYVAISLIAFFSQRSLLYFPSHDVSGSSQLTPWKIDHRVIGYAREVPNPRTCWLMLHGNAGQAGDRDYVLPRLAPTDSLYVLEYPGYGLRDGSPSRESMNAAAREAYEHLRLQNPGTPVGVIGESIGSGPACSLAQASTPPDKIVLLTPFDTLANVAARHMPLLPVRLILKDRWDNIAALRDYRGPVEIFGALDDTIIPMTHAKALAHQHPGAIFYSILGGHNDWSRNPSVRIER